ncbi:expansin-like B1 [Diospyros lotus]|uniref:expansin-like B1 n=1 Tax=Diospyros lotus TaxID=55363 RepID=UPI002258C959|nr:expansin-like B1 [Diospyros lotus]
MGSAPKSYFLLYMMALLPALCYTKDSHGGSKATYYNTPDGLGTPNGACGYGEYGRTVYGGNAGAVSNKLLRNGTGCGACYAVRCKIPHLCNSGGVKVVATGNRGDNTDFILSKHAYAAMANPKVASKLFACGVVPIEYKRVSCRYPNHNLAVKVHEWSRYPNYLAIVVLYQDGKSDITAVQVLQADGRLWRNMGKLNGAGAIWGVANPPRCALTLRIQGSGSRGQKWVNLARVIPRYWVPGTTYETRIKLA